MIRTLTVLSLTFGLTGVASAMDLASQTARSREVIKACGTTLKAERQAAMTEGGTMNTVGICTQSAPAFASKVSADTELSTGCTSQENRHSGNALKPELASKILTVYPDDEARGFDLRVLRGVFVVTDTIEP